MNERITEWVSEMGLNRSTKMWNMRTFVNKTITYRRTVSPNYQHSLQFRAGSSNCDVFESFPYTNGQDGRSSTILAMNQTERRCLLYSFHNASWIHGPNLIRVKQKLPIYSHATSDATPCCVWPDTGARQTSVFVRIKYANKYASSLLPLGLPVINIHEAYLD